MNMGDAKLQESDKLRFLKLTFSVDLKFKYYIESIDGPGGSMCRARQFLSPESIFLCQPFVLALNLAAMSYIMSLIII